MDERPYRAAIGRRWTPLCPPCDHLGQEAWTSPLTQGVRAAPTDLYANGANVYIGMGTLLLIILLLIIVF